MVNLPCVCLFFSAKSSSFLIASFCETVTANLTLLLVYSWPGYRLSEYGEQFHLVRSFTHIDLGIIGQSSKSLIQRLVHLSSRAFEEASTASDEEGVAGEYDAIVGCCVFEEKADAVLGMAGRVKSFDFDALADGECVAVGRGLGDLGTVFASDDGEGVFL